MLNCVTFIRSMVSISFFSLDGQFRFLSRPRLDVGAKLGQVSWVDVYDWSSMLRFVAEGVAAGRLDIGGKGKEVVTPPQLASGTAGVSPQDEIVGRHF